MKQFLLLFVTALFLSSCSYGQGNSNNNPSVKKLNMAMYMIENLYVDKVDGDKLADDAIKALLKELDPHSDYLSPEEVKEMTEPLQGNFDGIGVQFNMLTDTLYIIQVVPGGPSEKVGILAGDRIIAVDDTTIAGVKMKTNDVMKRLRGPKGTTVEVSVLRKNVPNLLTFKITRDKIPTYSLDASYMLDKETGYVKLSRFSATTHEEFVSALKKLQSQGMKNLILDLQGNGGGYLSAAIDMADEFLRQGQLIVYTEGVHQKREEAKATAKGNFEKGRLVVLVDESSASSSEILTAAIQDWDRGVVVGRRTFGKGLVQRPIPFPDGSMIKLTTARYYTPTGRSIQKPYENGDQDAYNKDLIDRYNHGEMLNADSIHFPDSLKYNTLVTKRTIYGGGGIMPDFFVPIDTSRYTMFHRNVVALGLVNKISMGIVDKSRNDLLKKYKNITAFSAGYDVPEASMNELLDLFREEKKTFAQEKKKQKPEVIKGEDEDIELAEAEFDESNVTQKDLDEYKKSKSLIALQIKALVARDLWDMSEYFQIINQDNEVLKKAMQVIENPKEYDKLLNESK